jgi:uncharacterized protein (TIGR02452 family)
MPEHPGADAMNRRQAAEVAEDTRRILDAGGYRAPSGTWVDIAEAVSRAVAGTRSYPPDQSPPALAATAAFDTRFAVADETTLVAARRFAEAGRRVAALNFASAKNPGGGFRTGARAQEETLARSSALYPCIASDPMYAFHRSRGDAWYSAWAIYSPDVPVLRDDDGNLLERPWLCSLVTAPAVNAGALRDRAGHAEAIGREMGRRIERVLTLMAAHGHEAIVLGAWGCGVFGNDTDQIAGLFADALTGRFRGVFAEVAFAVLDTSEDDRFIGPFRSRFGPAARS